MIYFRLRRRGGFGEIEEVLLEEQPYVLPEAVNGGLLLSLLMLDSDRRSLRSKPDE
jgi:hypothetical protein